MGFLLNESLKRTHLCGQIQTQDLNKKIILNAWVKKIRNHGKLIFIDLWDHSGTIQAVIDSEDSNLKNILNLHYDTILSVSGIIKERPAGMKNDKMQTGDFDFIVESGIILSQGETPPFRVGDSVKEDLALKYRYLDLRRREDLRKNLAMRHHVSQLIRKTLSDLDFQEIETPILYKGTPEGARDYLIPSRNVSGYFYALPQSPQILKQLLMISSFNRYFQISRCFRDEDLRSNRQPEFSQIDIEMSFVTTKDIKQISEKLLQCIWKEIKKEEIKNIPSLGHEEALNLFGTDKPDLRNPLRLKVLKEEISNFNVKIFKEAIEKNKSVRGLFVPESQFSRSQIDKLQEEAKSFGAKGLIWIQNKEGNFKSSISKLLSNNELEFLFDTISSVYPSKDKQKNGICFLIADEFKILNRIFSQWISKFANDLNLIDKNKTEFVWIEDFPLFEWNEEEKRWFCLHHPFTSLTEKDFSLFQSNDLKFEELAQLRSQAYDLVCNGYELAGGSIRNHLESVQKKIFYTLGMDDKNIESCFGFFLEALRYGAPPHGGIAWGLDRLLMILLGTDNIKDVIAFPKSSAGSCLMSQAPSKIDEKDLKELHIKIVDKKEE